MVDLILTKLINNHRHRRHRRHLRRRNRRRHRRRRHHHLRHRSHLHHSLLQVELPLLGVVLHRHNRRLNRHDALPQGVVLHDAPHGRSHLVVACRDAYRCGAYHHGESQQHGDRRGAYHHDGSQQHDDHHDDNHHRGEQPQHVGRGHLQRHRGRDQQHLHDDHYDAPPQQ